jgi:hypothetical protein
MGTSSTSSTSIRPECMSVPLATLEFTPDVGVRLAADGSS